jgi:lipopolysaccharide transport system permease protein
LINLFSAALLPLFNLFLFMFWAPAFVCLLGARYRDFYQLVPIVLQLAFLLSPILYRKDNLGAMAWTANLNPLYRVLSPVRNSMIFGDFHLVLYLLILFFNIIGILASLYWLNRVRPHLPFLI